MIHFYKYGIVLACILCGSLGCAPSKTTESLPIASNCCGPQIRSICLASYFGQDRATYITRQTHWFCPCGQILQIRAHEPQGEFLWQLHNHTFSIVSPVKNSAKNGLFDKTLSMAVFYSMASATELLPLAAANPPAEPIKLEGQWYIPFIYHAADPTITLLKSKDTGKFDLVKIQDKKTILLARSYNFRFNEVLQKNISQVIDVFNIADGLATKKLVLQLQYIQIEPRY